MFKRREFLDGLLLCTTVDSITDEDRTEAVEKFKTLQDQGTIIGEYEADVWYATDQRKKYCLNFTYREKEMRQICELHNISYQDFIITFKLIIVMIIGTRSLINTRMLISATIDELIKNDFGYKKLNGLNDICVRDQLISLYESVIRILPNIPQDYIHSVVTKRNIVTKQMSKKYHKTPTQMADFQTYFMFDHLLRKSWADMSDDDQMFFFPLYLFWLITNIIPLRVTEFCLTPYDCIRKDGDDTYITIRRTTLKGSGEKVHAYILDNDYNTFEYAIPYKIYELIDTYRIRSKDFKRNYDLLFSVAFLKKHSNYKDYMFLEDERIFDDRYLNQLLDLFYTNFVVKNGYTIVTDSDLLDRFLKTDSVELQKYEIMRFKLKDTRHLAMINLITRGCNPALIKDFAGHANASISENYYGNTSNMIKCGVKYYFDLSKNREHIISTDSFQENPLSLIIDENQSFIQLDDGKCYSQNFAAGNPIDCITYDGQCHTCRYFKNQSRFAVTDTELGNQSSIIDNELTYLCRMLKSSDIENHIEEFQNTMLRSQSEIAGLAAKFWKELEEKENS